MTILVGVLHPSGHNIFVLTNGKIKLTLFREYILKKAISLSKFRSSNHANS